MDIFIKSFNRPYHLDRCIFTIKKFVENYSSIIILDDGTPQKYLDKIQSKYPETVIKKSEFYAEKSEAIENETITKENLKFPGKFWHREISQGSEYFLLLEDDFFIINPIDLADIQRFMQEKKIYLYKLMWQGRKEVKDREKENFGTHELVSTSKKYFSSESFRRLSNNKYRQRNRFDKIFGIGSYFKYFMLPFYKFYTVAGAVVDKKIFLEMWKDIDHLNEFTQIYRMLKFYEDQNIPLKIGKAKTESIETTYLTSATNEFPNIDLSIFDFNRDINEAWLTEDFDSNYRLPKDYGREYFKKFIPREKHPEFDKWIKEFAGNYINLGCKVEID